MNWNSEETLLLLNSKWPTKDLEALQKLVDQFPLKAHCWIPSSGSSATEFQSVKVIALSKAALLASAKAANQHLQSTGKDIWAQVLPEFHVGGLGVQARAFLTGARVVNGLRDENWNAEYFLQVLREEKVSLTALVPTQVFDLIQTGQRPPESLRAIVVGGAFLSDEIYQAAIQKGWPLLPSFGMTECCSQIATAALDSWKKSDRELILLSHIEAEIEETGLLKIRSPSLLTGFAQWQGPQAKWVDPKQAGWLVTEDKASLAGRKLQPLGRGADFIKISGEGVDLRLLQEKLESLVQARFPLRALDFVLIAIPEERRGHQLVLVVSRTVVAKDAQEIQQDFSRLVAPYEKISQLISVDEIPRSALGKLEKEKLKLRVLTELERKLE